jgi:hypothetical protein
MNINDLKAKGGFVPLAPIKKEVTWTRMNDAGEEISDTFDIYVKRQSFGTIEAIWSGEKDRSKSADYISQSIRLGPGGKETLTYDEAYQLDTGLATAFIVAINEVNGTGDAKAKN